MKKLGPLFGRGFRDRKDCFSLGVFMCNEYKTGLRSANYNLWGCFHTYPLKCFGDRVTSYKVALFLLPVLVLVPFSLLVFHALHALRAKHAKHERFLNLIDTKEVHKFDYYSQ